MTERDEMEIRKLLSLAENARDMARAASYNAREYERQAKEIRSRAALTAAK